MVFYWFGVASLYENTIEGSDKEEGFPLLRTQTRVSQQAIGAAMAIRAPKVVRAAMAIRAPNGKRAATAICTPRAIREPKAIRALVAIKEPKAIMNLNYHKS